MANATAQTSVQQVLNLLSRTRLLSPDEVRALFGRWRKDAGAGVDDVQQFRRWLVAQKVVTDFQVDRLVRGQTHGYFFNDYKVLDLLGVGGMAGVYKAVHRLGAIVAIKVLPPTRAKKRVAFERFKREARMAIRMKHPNIVRTYQIAKADGLYHIVMEYLEGETLKEVLEKRGKLSPPDAVRIVHQVLLGLEYMHQQGVIHRDLKPMNLMLVPPGGKGSVDPATAVVKILDIGLGREVFDENAPEPQGQDLTAPGTILGTAAYMAPEQTKNSHAADIRSDIYSLGCVLYQCLAGRPPFVDKQTVQLLISHATQTPPPLVQFNPQVPDGLQQIVNWMMAKDPAKRYPTPERAVQALQVFLNATQPRGPVVGEVATQEYLQWLAGQAEPEDPELEDEPAPAGVLSAPVAVAQPAVAPQPGVPMTLPPWAQDKRILIAGAGGLLLMMLFGCLLLRLVFGK
jgi:serine/threonine protein kinase